MKIATLQFAPALGKVEENIQRAEAVLSKSSIKPNDLDLLVLPELAFTGYNFPSLEAITPQLEPTAAGPTTRWAQRTARTLNCVVVVGYPEDASSAPPHLQPGPSVVARPSRLPAELATGTPVVPNEAEGFAWNFNASVAVSPAGEVVAHYRKSFLYYTDATWARAGSGFWSGALALPGVARPQALQPAVANHQASKSESEAGVDKSAGIKCAIGICMDLNPHNFTSPWDAFEFGKHVLACDAELVIVNMAWLSHDLVTEMVQGDQAAVPDEYTVGYWMERFRPLFGVADGKTRVLVLANRCGVEGDVCYAGTSAVIGVKDGQALIWDICGKGEERACVVDTELAPKYIYRMQRHDDVEESEDTRYSDGE